MHKVPPQVSWYICETNVPSDNVQVMSEVTFAHDVYLNVTLTKKATTLAYSITAGVHFVVWANVRVKLTVVTALST